METDLASAGGVVGFIDGATVGESSSTEGLITGNVVGDIMAGYTIWENVSGV